MPWLHSTQPSHPMAAQAQVPMAIATAAAATAAEVTLHLSFQVCRVRADGAAQMSIPS